MTGHEPDPQGIADRYDRETAVQLGDAAMTLGQALDMEAMFCPADQPKRQDQTRRNRYLARILDAAGQLRDEDRHLLADKPTGE